MYDTYEIFTGEIYMLQRAMNFRWKGRGHPREAHSCLLSLIHYCKIKLANKYMGNLSSSIVTAGRLVRLKRITDAL